MYHDVSGCTRMYCDVVWCIMMKSNEIQDMTQVFWLQGHIHIGHITRLAPVKFANIHLQLHRLVAFIGGLQVVAKIFEDRQLVVTESHRSALQGQRKAQESGSGTWVDHHPNAVKTCKNILLVNFDQFWECLSSSYSKMDPHHLSKSLILAEAPSSKMWPSRRWSKAPANAKPSSMQPPVQSMQPVSRPPPIWSATRSTTKPWPFCLWDFCNVESESWMKAGWSLL